VVPHRTTCNHAGLWRIKFSYETGEPLSVDIVQPSTMASSLHELSEIELGEENSRRSNEREALLHNVKAYD
jgi:hypothetical protein